MKRGFEALNEMEAEIRRMRAAMETVDYESDMSASLVLSTGAKRLCDMSHGMVTAARDLGFVLPTEVWVKIARFLLSDRLQQPNFHNWRVKDRMLPLRLLQRTAGDAVATVMIDVVNAVLPMPWPMPRDNVASFAALFPELRWCIPFLVPRERSHRNERTLRACIKTKKRAWDVPDPKFAFEFGKRFAGLIRPLVKNQTVVYGTGESHFFQVPQFLVSEVRFGFKAEFFFWCFALRFAPAVLPWHAEWYARAVDLVSRKMKRVKSAEGRYLNMAGTMFSTANARMSSHFFRATCVERVCVNADCNVSLVSDIDFEKFEAYLDHGVALINTMHGFIMRKDNEETPTQDAAVAAEQVFNLNYESGETEFYEKYLIPYGIDVFARKFAVGRLPDVNIKSRA